MVAVGPGDAGRRWGEPVFQGLDDGATGANHGGQPQQPEWAVSRCWMTNRGRDRSVLQISLILGITPLHSSIRQGLHGYCTNSASSQPVEVSIFANMLNVPTAASN